MERLLPDFTEEGLLPPDDYMLTLEQLRESVLVCGPEKRDDYPKQQLPMWHQYRVELYPHYGQLSGIRDGHGHELEFPSAFRQSRRDGTPRGIIKIGDSA
jgi:hypothetical protein